MKAKIIKSPNHELITIFKNNNYNSGYMVQISKKELEEFLKDEYVDIKEFEHVK